MAKSSIPSADDYMRLVGRVCAAWAVLELNFEQAIKMIVGGNPNQLGCVTGQFSSHYPKLKAVIALCKFHEVSNDTVKRLNSYLGSLTTLSERRNRLIHDAWLVKGGEIVGKATPDPTRDPSAKTIEELQQLNLDINKRIGDFAKLRLQFLAEIQTSHETPP